MDHHYDHLIIGAGMAGAAAANAIRETDPQASIALLGADTHAPYDRPPLSKALWKGDAEDSIWRSLGENISTHFGRRAVTLDADAHQVTDDQGDHYTYGKLLLASGGQPRHLSFDGDRVIHYRTLDDYHRLRKLAQPGAHIAVIGGGFIGSEIAAALASNGCKVTMLFPDQSIGQRVYPTGLSTFLNDYYREHGIKILAGSMVTGGNADANGVRLDLDDGSHLDVDAVVAGIGIVVDTELAKQAGASIDNGVVVDECMRTSVPDIYAAGDLAAFPSQALGKRIRVEHEDAANHTGRTAGRSMAGKPEPYTELPMFYSDLFDLGYEAVGTLDARLDIVEHWRKPNREGVIYYLEAGRVRGVLLWNTWDQVDTARALIADPGPHSAESLRGKIGG